MTDRIAIVLMAALLASGCATVKEGFVGAVSEHIDPFAEASIELMTLDRIEFRRTELVYLRPYYEDNAESAELSELLAGIDRYRDDIVNYSLELVHIASSFPTDEAKCNALAESIGSSAEIEVLGGVGPSNEDLRQLADDLRGQTDFLECLRTVQPMVERSGDALQREISRAEDELVPALVAQLDASIEEEYSVVIAQLDSIYERRDGLLRQLLAIDAGEGNSSDRARVIGALRAENELLELLDRDVADYKATHVELDIEEQEILDGLELARRQALSWVRAHEDLAEGVRNPGRWLAGVFQVADAYKRLQ